MGREDDLLAHRGPGVAKRRARGHALGDHLDAREHGVSLVEVIGVDVEPELPERADAAHPEQDLLRHAAVEGRLVETVRDPPIGLGGRFEEEERSVAPARDPPDAGLDLARPDPDAHPYPRVLEEVGSIFRKVVDRDVVGREALARVAPRPAEPDGNHRAAEVVSGFDVVAGEDAEAAGIDRELGVQAELHAEVGDGRCHVRPAAS